MPTPELVPLFDIDLEVAPPVIAPTSVGSRVITAVTGGKFVGDRISGTALGGGDWALVDSRGTFGIDGRLTLQITDGPVVNMTYRGRLSMPPDSMERIMSGETLDPEAIYFRTAPTFEVCPDSDYAWLNSVQAVAVGTLGPGIVAFWVYQVS